MSSKKHGRAAGIKPLARVIAFDDGFFRPRTKSSTKLIGVVYRLDGRIEGVLSTDVRVDSLNSTRRIISLLRGSRFLAQSRFILLDGINFAGFNLVDMELLHRRLNRPVIAVFRRHPDLARIRKALSGFRDRSRRLALLEKAGPIHKAAGVHFQFCGTDEATAREVIKKCSVHSNIPEPLRLSHLIASGVTRGESTRP